MFMRSLLKLSIAVMCLIVLACNPPPTRDTRRIGRLPRGYANLVNVNGQISAVQPSSSGTLWGQVTGSSGDQAFQDELFYFSAPMLGTAGSADSLGYVSSQANQSTGVVFWGRAYVLGSGMNRTGFSGGYLSGGQLDGSSAVLHIEIWDNKAGTLRSDGTTIPQMIVHIGADQTGFVSAQGSVQGNQAYLTFSDQMGSVVLQGTISGQYFTGTMGYSNDQTGGQTRPLGQFQVPVCGFFVCN